MDTKARYSPNEFLRKRRPERFSDSKIVEQARLDRTLLEYHLDTLTNRSQEGAFQNFAKRLAQKTLCPNLRPQTGPTGGGDSKADSETFPVSEQIELGWYVGVNSNSAQDKWAFAFSAGKRWKPKIISDIAKIVATERGYRKAIFISSQYIPDKKRSELEDELSQKWALPVTILDRSWILDQVFSGGHEDIAVEELGISGELRSQIEVGPNDLVRGRSLEKVEKEIRELLNGKFPGTRVALRSIEAAMLARELELPRGEVEQRHLRAIKIAETHGSDHERIRALYQYAWTMFWWFDDFEKFTELYSDFEASVKDTRLVGNLRLLQNLWFLSFTIDQLKEVKPDPVRSASRVDLLVNCLEGIAQDEQRPSASLEARAMLLVQEATSSLPAVPTRVFSDLKHVLSESETLVGFAPDDLVEVILGLGDILADNGDYDELCDWIAIWMQNRTGEITSATTILRRAMQKADSGKLNDAIDLVGRALVPLWKNETRPELLSALYVAAYCYERIGLFWAARGSLINAASLIANDFRDDKDPTKLQPWYFQRLKWLEMMLGRLPHALAWYEIERVLKSAARGENENESTPSDEALTFDVILGIQILKCDLGQLKKTEKLPDSLEKIELFRARLALIYALGCVEEVDVEIKEFGGNDEDLLNFFLKWRDQPAAAQLPTHTELCSEPTVGMSSRVLGCEFNVVASENPACEALAESFLAALEALLSTAFREKIVPKYTHTHISIIQEDNLTTPFEFKIEARAQGLFCAIRCSEFNPHTIDRRTHHALKDKLFELVTHVVAAEFLFDNFEASCGRLFGDLKGFDRSLGFTGSFVTLGNVLGHDPNTRLQSWIDDRAKTFPLKRSELWDTGHETRVFEEPDFTERTGGFEDDIDHRKMANLSVIHIDLWDRAKWSGVGFAYGVDPNAPPILALIFNESQAGNEIFNEWQQRFGREVNEDLSIAFIRGINRQRPLDYRIAVGSNVSVDKIGRSGGRFVTNSRTHTMNPTSSFHFDDFLARYRRVGRFLLCPGRIVGQSGRQAMDFNLQLALGFSKLTVKQAWEIGVNDLESVAIMDDDDPILPDNGKIAPVLELMKKKATSRN